MAAALPLRWLMHGPQSAQLLLLAGAGMCGLRLAPRRMLRFGSCFTSRPHTQAAFGQALGHPNAEVSDVSDDVRRAAVMASAPDPILLVHGFST